MVFPRSFLTYVVARSSAAEMDRRGPPGPFFRAFVLIPAAIVTLGFSGLVLFFAVSFTLWKLGIG